MHSLVRIAASIVFSLMLSACATVQSHEPRDLGGERGYSQRRLDQTHWRIGFGGDGRASRALVESNLLYSAAELTLRSHYVWFKIDDNDGQNIAAAPFSWRLHWRRRSQAGWSDWDAAQAPIPGPGDLFAVHVVFVMGTGSAPAGAFDAGDVERQSVAPTLRCDMLLSSR